MTGNPQQFTATIIGMDKMDAAYIHIPFDVYKVWGKRGLVKVKAVFDGYLYRGSIAKMEKGDVPHLLIMTQAVRKAINKRPGDTVHVVLEQDFEERILEIPKSLQEAFEKNRDAGEYFAKLAHSRRSFSSGFITSLLVSFLMIMGFNFSLFAFWNIYELGFWIIDIVVGSIFWAVVGGVAGAVLGSGKTVVVAG